MQAERTPHTPPISRLAIVVPCHNEESVIPLFVEEVDKYTKVAFAEGLIGTSEFVFVDDGSSDSTLEVMRRLAKTRDDVRYCSLSRNFGKEAALLCGMKRSLEIGYTHIVVMDVDLQDPPSLLPLMMRRLEEKQVDVVAAYRSTRKGEPRVRSWFAKLFYRIENRICNVEMKNGARDYRLMTSRVVKEVCRLTERERFSKGLFLWVGFDTEWIGYENIERSVGETSWSFFSLVRYAFDGIISFSNVPLELISTIGIFLSALSLIGLLAVWIRALCYGDPVAGWPSLVCIILLLGGLQLSALGLIGLYLSKTLSEAKQRPHYIEKERENDSDS